MSVFVFDQNTIGMIRYILALQHFKEYLAGPQGIDQTLCALSFSRVLIQTALKFPKFQKENPSDIRMNEVIRFLEQKNHIDSAAAKKLREYMNFCDDLVRTSSQAAVDMADPKAQEILMFLCNEAGLNVDEELENRSFEEIVNLDTGSSSANMAYEKLVESDFDNLDKLYRKCPSLQLEIEKKLSVPLRRGHMSGFTPFTGGIWLPFVIAKTLDNRAHIDRASVGVTFTPINIRIGLNFGSRAHKYRIRYYQMLLDGELTGEVESLNNKDKGYCLCDTFWHYHIRNIQSLQWCLALYSSTRIALERAIEETKQLEGKPLTVNNYLISKVINRRPEDFAYAINGIVDEISTALNDLYPTLALIDKG